MNVSVGKRWEEFVESVVVEGRYRSASEVVREGLRLVEEREARLRELKCIIDRSIAKGGAHTSDEVMNRVEQALAEAGLPEPADE